MINNDDDDDILVYAVLNSLQSLFVSEIALDKLFRLSI
jgi:hypothetical protein